MALESAYERLEAVRPAVGMLAPAALGSWVAVLAAEKLSWQRYLGAELDISLSFFLLVVAAAVGFLVLVVLRRKQELLSLVKAAVPTFVATMCVFACGTLYWDAWQEDVSAIAELFGAGEPVFVTLTGDPAQRDYGQVSAGTVQLGGHAVSMRVLWPDGAEAFSAGHVVEVRGTFKAPADDEGGRWNHQQGHVGMVYASECVESGYCSGLRGWIAPLRDASMRRISSLGGDAAGLLAGILIGNKTLYSKTELEQDFRTTGLAHLMAVSGTHLAVVAMLSSWVLGRLPMRRQVKSLLLSGLLISYVALTAFAPSALRACLMCLVALCAAQFKRRRHSLSALSVCIVAFLGLEPSLAFSVGYQLSVLCMLGLLVFSPLLSTWLEQLLPEGFQPLSGPVGATLAANLATLPATIPLFCQLPLVSPLATLLASPFITLALMLGIPGLLFTGPLSLLGNALLFVSGAVANACGALVRTLANLPMACVPLDASANWLGALFALLAIGLWAMWPLPDKGDVHRTEGGRAWTFPVLKAVLAAAIASPLLLVLLVEMGGAAGIANLVAPGAIESDAQVVMLDVGQGDAMLIRDGDAAVLVDTGEDGSVLLKALARQGVTRLDAVVLSHLDADHSGALSALTGVIDVGHVYIHRDLLNYEGAATVLEAASWVLDGRVAEGVSPGSRLLVGRFSMELLSPEDGGEGGNEDSLLWSLGFDSNGDGDFENAGLLTGDGEEREVASVVKELGDVQFVKVGHHGSRGAFDKEELSALKPEIALIGVGADNDYGHPTKDILDLLEDCGAMVFRTDTDGDISLMFEGSRIGVSTSSRP